MSRTWFTLLWNEGPLPSVPFYFSLFLLRSWASRQRQRKESKLSRTIVRFEITFLSLPCYIPQALCKNGIRSLGHLDFVCDRRSMLSITVVHGGLRRSPRCHVGASGWRKNVSILQFQHFLCSFLFCGYWLHIKSTCAQISKSMWTILHNSHSSYVIMGIIELLQKEVPYDDTHWLT